MPLTIAVGRTGQPWESALIEHFPDAPQARTLVDLLVIAELRAPQVVVVAEDFPRLMEGLAQLRRLCRVVIVGHSAWSDCPPTGLTPARLRELVTPGPGARGQVVTVWGPQGSWGVTTVAIGLARSLSQQASTLLLDANVHVASVGDELAHPLGGLLHACLAADRGAVDLPVRTQGQLSVLTGVEPHMYPSVHQGALQQVLDAARLAHEWVVADVDSSVDSAGDIGLVPDWTTATMVTLQHADQVVIVIGESQRSHARLWRALPTVAEVMTGRATVVVNRCRNPRVTTQKLAQRLGDYLPEAAVGWVRDQVTAKSLAPIVAEVTRQVPPRGGR